jgi:hypothetical protein
MEQQVKSIFLLMQELRNELAIVKFSINVFLNKYTID